MPEIPRATRIARELFLATLVRDNRRLAWATARLASMMEDVEVRAGATIFESGEPSSEYFFVMNGKVKLVMPEARDWTVTGPGLVGVIDAMLERPHVRTAIAATDCHLLRMKVVDWLDVLEDSYEMATSLLRNMATAAHELRLRPPPSGGFDPPPPSAPTAQARAERLNMVERILLLREVSLFRHASIQALTSLAEVTEMIPLAAGEELLTSEHPPGKLFVVVAGEVEATHAKAKLVARFGRASLVCGEAAILDYPGYVAHAATASVVLAIRIEDYLDLVEEHFGLARSAMRSMAEQNEAMLQRDPNRGPVVMKTGESAHQGGG